MIDLTEQILAHLGCYLECESGNFTKGSLVSQQLQEAIAKLACLLLARYPWAKRCQAVLKRSIVVTHSS